MKTRKQPGGTTDPPGETPPVEPNPNNPRPR